MMSISDITPRIKTIDIHGSAFEIAQITPRCFVLTSLKTGEVRQFRSGSDLWKFVAELSEYIARKRSNNAQESTQ